MIIEPDENGVYDLETKDNYYYVVHEHEGSNCIFYGKHTGQITSINHCIIRFGNEMSMNKYIADNNLILPAEDA